MDRSSSQSTTTTSRLARSLQISSGAEGRYHFPFQGFAGAKASHSTETIMTNAPDPSSNEVLRLVALLRQQDQLLYKVSQCTTWEQMRPYIRELCDGMYERMRDESDRIRSLMIPQIREAYLNASPPAQPKLTGPSDDD